MNFKFFKTESKLPTKHIFPKLTVNLEKHETKFTLSTKQTPLSQLLSLCLKSRLKVQKPIKCFLKNFKIGGLKLII